MKALQRSMSPRSKQPVTIEDLRSKLILFAEGKLKEQLDQIVFDLQRTSNGHGHTTIRKVNKDGGRPAAEKRSALNRQDSGISTWDLDVKATKSMRSHEPTTWERDVKATKSCREHEYYSTYHAMEPDLPVFATALESEIPQTRRNRSKESTHPVPSQTTESSQLLPTLTEEVAFQSESSSSKRLERRCTDELMQKALITAEKLARTAAPKEGVRRSQLLAAYEDEQMQQLDIHGIDTEEEAVKKTWLASCVTHRGFDVCVMSLIGLNAMVVGLQADYSARHASEKPPGWWYWADAFFCLTFTIELTLRFLVYGSSLFSADEWKSTAFDISVVALQAMEVLPLSRTGWFANLTVLRIFRVTRLLRVFPMVRNVQELKLLLLSLEGAMGILFWVVMVLVLTMYTFGVYVTQAVADSRAKRPDMEHVDAIVRMYGSVPRSMLTLYQMISHGIEWGEALEYIIDVSPWMTVTFSVFMFITEFAILNVVTGVIFKCATAAAEESSDRKSLNMLRRIFESGDTDGSGTLNLEEFLTHLNSEKVIMCLKSLNLEMYNAMDLFEILDSDQSGEIDMDEFVDGCLKFKTTSRKMDIIACRKNITERFDQLQDAVHFEGRHWSRAESGLNLVEM